MSGLEKAASEAAEPGPPGETTAVYARLREDARARIRRDLEIGEKPLFWIDDAGIIRATDDGSFVRHLGDFVQAIDRKMRRLEHEIAEDRANMSPEEIRRADAKDKASLAVLSNLSIDEGIAFLNAEIAQIIAQIAADEAEEEGDLVNGPM